MTPLFAITKESLPDFARSKLGDLAHFPGKILYSSHETLRQGDVYLLGYNPGGSEGPTIANSIDGMLTYNENAYLDECWNNGAGEFDVGKADLQLRVEWLVNALGFNLREVCASNLIFAQSRNAIGVDARLADRCWPVHEAIIGIVKPKIILAFGNGQPSPFMYIHQVYQGEIKYIPSGYGNWHVKIFSTMISGQPVKVIGFPHFSYYSPTPNGKYAQCKIDMMKQVKDFMLSA